MKLFGYTLSKSKKKPVRSKKNRAEYKIVSSWGQTTMSPSSPDNRTEDEILNSYDRARVFDLTRNLVRNSSLFNTIITSLTTNVVSVDGGKVVLNFDNDGLNKLIKYEFSKFTRNADFYTGHSFNHILKRILREYVITGDCVLVFDSLIENSGKILLFEAEEIVNVAPEEVVKHYGLGSYQSQGKVYTQNGRHIGTVVSKSQRGCQGFANPDCCYFLKKDPNSLPFENYWLHFSANWREGRGISQAVSAIGTIHQIEDLVTSELMASRRNAQIFCWLLQKPEKTEENIPSAFDASTNYDEMTDEEIDEAINEEVSETKTISFNKARESSITYEALPEGVTAQQLSMSHPNNNVQVMVDWLANRAASTLGISKIFATGNPDDSNWRSNQLFSYPAILEFQKELEQICDWTFYRFLLWLKKTGVINYEVNLSTMGYVAWTWKGIDTLDPVANENAINLKLSNMTASYKDILGNSWKDRLLQTAYERKWMIENGITPPQDLMKSGGQTESSKILGQEDKPELVQQEFDFKKD